MRGYSCWSFRKYYGFKKLLLVCTHLYGSLVRIHHDEWLGSANRTKTINPKVSYLLTILNTILKNSHVLPHLNKKNSQGLAQGSRQPNQGNMPVYNIHIIVPCIIEQHVTMKYIWSINKYLNFNHKIDSKLQIFLAHKKIVNIHSFDQLMHMEYTDTQVHLIRLINA